MAAPSRVTVRLNVTSEVLNNFHAGAAPQLAQNAREQAERAAHVRFYGQNVEVGFVEANEVWLVEEGKTTFAIDFIFEVTPQ